MVLQIRQEGIQRLSPEPFPWALLYRGAVSWETIEACSGRSIWSGLDRLNEEERWCLARRDEVSELIFASIGTIPEEEGALRRKLIRLRRDLYTMQTVITEEALQAFTPGLSEPAFLQVQAYWHRSQEVLRLKAELQGRLQQELVEARRRLWEIVRGTPALLKGVALIAPELYDQARRFMDATFEPRKGRLEKEEISLLLYLVRTATKTSAFSTFTSVALAHAEIGDQEHCQLVVPDERQVSVASVNHLPLVLLTHTLTRDPALRRDLLVHSNPYCVEEEGLYKIVRTANYRATMRNVSHTQVERLSLPMTSLLKELRAYVESTRCTPRQLSSWLQQRLDLPDRSRAEQFIERLLEMQLFVFDLQGLQTRAIVPDLLAQLREGPEELPARRTIVEALERIERDQQSYPDQSPQQRVETERHLNEAIQTCFETLGEPLDPRARVTEPAFYESSILPRQDLRVCLPNDEGLLDDFQLLARVLPVFDTNALPRAILTSFFRRTYGQGGECGDLLQFLLKLRQSFPEDAVEFMTGGIAPVMQIELPETLREYIEEASEMLRLRAELVDTLVEAMRSADEELIIDRALLQRVAERVSPIMRGYAQQHYAYMCQSVPRAGGDLLVLNNISNGWGRQIEVHAANLIQIVEDPTRAAPDERLDLHTVLRENIARLSPAGHECVELVATQGFNGNIHPFCTRRVLMMPGEWCDLPREHQLTLHDLRVVHDAQEDRLRLIHTREGTEIHLLYMGQLFPGFLGPLQRWLQPLTPSFMWGDGFLLSAFLDGQPTDSVLHYPRVRLGQLVLSRRKWIMPAKQWPQWESRKLPELAQVLEIEQWRRSQGLPEQVYVRPVLSKRIKPQFVDFRHLLLMAALPKRLQSLQGQIKVEEALPKPDEYHLTREGKHVASTFWIELRPDDPCQ